MSLAELPEGFELDHLALALEYCQNFRTAVDGGANRGIWTVEMAKRFKQVLAFEPVEENRKRIPEMDNVQVWGRGLSHKFEHVVMEPGESNTGEWYARPVEGRCGVIMGPLDSLRLSEVDFIKLDIEGYELFALQGARETILRCHPTICVEEKWHCERYGVPQGEATRYLEAMGYRVAAKVGRDVILTC